MHAAGAALRVHQNAGDLRAIEDLQVLGLQSGSGMVVTAVEFFALTWHPPVAQ